MNDDLSLILQKAESKLKTAGIDFEGGQYDDAVSRAYYAVFHALTGCLLEKGLAYSSHSQVIGVFNREFVKTEIFPKDVTKDIQILFDDRQSGDYDIESSMDESTAKTDIAKARRIVGMITKYLEDKEP